MTRRTATTKPRPVTDLSSSDVVGGNPTKEDPLDRAALILTLQFDEAGFAIFEAARRSHFPPERNFIPAHLTLFHHLPGKQHGAISAALASCASGHRPFRVAVKGLRFLGNGMAYAIESPLLSALRGDFARRWAADLTPQDSQGFRPHVTIQNKVAAPVARALFDQLSASFEPFEVVAMGLLLWRYRGGPWERSGEFAFAT
jgi:2'-5' RNA ligase